MIHITTFTGHNYNECIDHINSRIPDSDKIINVIPRGSKESTGWDEYDVWTTYYMDVIYKD